MIRIEEINEENKEEMKKIVNEQHNELLDGYIAHLNNMYERNKEGLDKSIFIYEDDELVLYLDFAIVNKAMFLTNKYFVSKIKDRNAIMEAVTNEYSDYSLINFELV